VYFVHGLAVVEALDEIGGQSGINFARSGLIRAQSNFGKASFVPGTRTTPGANPASKRATAKKAWDFTK